MIPVEAWTTIRYLHAQGKSIRSIARQVHVARNTVRAALRDVNPPAYSRPPRPNPKLAPFLAQIDKMVLQDRFIGSRVLRELVAQGYDGGPTALYDYLRSLKAATASVGATARFETPPAQQGQFDASPYTISVGAGVCKVHVFCLILAYSRRKFYWPSLDETQVSTFEALEAGLHYFGGAPKQLLVDNARTLVSVPDPARFAWNRHFLELCGHYGIEPHACQPGRPQTKGKVERPFFYLEQHFIKGHTWASFDDFARSLADFAAEELDHLVHSTTGEQPVIRFEAERELLTPLPPRPFVGTLELMRKVSSDCLISYEGSRYSVPWPYSAKQVWLRPSQGLRLSIRNQQGEVVARHALATRKGSSVIDPAHYDGLRSQVPRTRQLVEREFLRLYPDHLWFVEALFIQRRNNGLQHLRAILGLAQHYTPETLLAAFARAKEYNTYSHSFIRGLLERDATPHTTLPSVAQTAATSLPADLSVYQRVLEAGR
jgi:transposase